MIASIKDGIVNVCGEEYYRGSESEGWKKYRNEKNRKYGEKYHRGGTVGAFWQE